MSDYIGVSKSARNPQYGILYIIIMTGCIVSMDASAKMLSGDMPLLMVVWGRYLFNFVFVSLFFFRGGTQGLVRTQRFNLQILRSILGLSSTLAFWWGLVFLSLADCVAIAFISPLLVTVLSAPFLGEKVGIHRWTAVFVGFSGAMIIIRPGLGIMHRAVVLPVIAALFWANYQIATRVLSRTDHALTTLFYTSAGALFFTSLAVWSVWMMPSLKQGLLLAWMGLLGTMGHFFLIKAYEISQASMLAPFSYTSIVWSTLLGFVLFGDFPDGWTIAGAVIIMASGFYIIQRERHQNNFTGKNI
jgi:drug/metabolite transporter (DMT)-like permease